MASSVSSACKGYFGGFRDLSTFSNNDACKNILGIFKVISYFTIVIPLFFGLVYGVSSLIGRVTVTSSENQSDGDQRVSSASRRALGQQTVEQQLEELFRSTTKAQKLFTIEGSKVGVIYNPGGESLRAGFLTVSDPVVLVSNKSKSIPEEVSNRITAKMPPGATHSTVCFGNINGRSTFAVLGFE